MKQFVFALLLSIPIIRLSFAQTEIIANDYYDIEFCDSNKSKDVREEFDASNHEKGIPYKICDVRIVSFDTQMNCIKTHIHFTLKEKHWIPEMESYHGKIEFINDSIVSYTSNGLLKGKRNIIRSDYISGRDSLITFSFKGCPALSPLSSKNNPPRRGDTHAVQVTPYKRSAVWCQSAVRCRAAKQCGPTTAPSDLTRSQRWSGTVSARTGSSPRPNASASCT